MSGTFFLFPLSVFSIRICPRRPSASTTTPKTSSAIPHHRFTSIPRLFHTPPHCRASQAKAVRIVPDQGEHHSHGNARVHLQIAFAEFSAGNFFMVGLSSERSGLPQSPPAESPRPAPPAASTTPHAPAAARQASAPVP